MPEPPRGHPSYFLDAMSFAGTTRVQSVTTSSVTMVTSTAVITITFMSPIRPSSRSRILITNRCSSNELINFLDSIHPGVSVLSDLIRLQPWRSANVQALKKPALQLVAFLHQFLISHRSRGRLRMTYVLLAIIV